MSDVQVTRAALSTAASGTQDITISGFGTPTAALFICTNAVTNDVMASDAFMSIGFTDGTRTRCTAVNSDDGSSTSFTSRTSQEAVIAKPAFSGLFLEMEFDFNSFITDGVRLTITNDAAAAYLCTVILFKGTANAYVDDVVLTTGTTPINVTDPGFEPDLVFMTGTGVGSYPHIGTQSILSFGIGNNDGSDTQRMVGWHSGNSLADARVTNYLTNTTITGQTLNGAQPWTAAIGGYDSSGFTMTPIASAGNDIVFYLAVKFTNALQIDLFDTTYPSSGNYVETTPGFQPDFGFLAFNTGPTVRNSATEVSTGAWSLTAFDATNIYSNCISEENDAPTTDCHSFSDTNLRALTEGGFTNQIDTSGYTLGSNGWTFTRNGGAAVSTLGFGLAIGPVATLEVNVGTANETDSANDMVPDIGNQEAVETANETNTAHSFLGGEPQAITITQFETTTDSPVIRGTAGVDFTDINLTIDGTDLYTTKSLSGVWRAPTNPWEIAETVKFTRGAGADNYLDGPIIGYTKDGNLLAVFRRGGAHASNDGRLFRSISTDNGDTWGPELMIYDSPTGYDTRNQAGGIDPATGRVIVFMRIYDASVPDTEDMGYITSDDHGVTWSDFTSIASQFSDSTTGQYNSYGPMVRTANGLMQTFYHWKDAWVLFSKDDGKTWGDRVTLYSNWPEANPGIGEVSAIAVDLHRIVCIIRDNNAKNSFRYIKSSDGGKTWSAISSAYVHTNAIFSFSAPAHGIRVEDDLLLCWHTRSSDWTMYTNRMNIEEFWTTPQNAWLYNGPNNQFRTAFSTAQTSTDIDWAYPWMAVRSGHEYTVLLAWYDLFGLSSGGIKMATFPRLA